MTHPLREAKSGGTRQCKRGSGQFDPDELKRKLQIHLAEQMLQAERRRAEASADKQSAYHHVPKVAAADFARTATPELMGQKEKKKRYIHRLARAALKHHVKETTIPLSGSFDLRQTQAIDEARKQRDLLGDRNQFQRTRDLEDAAQFDKERNLNKVPQRTFRTDHLDIPKKAQNCRPLSTGDLIWEDDIDTNNIIFQVKPKAKALPTHTAQDRQDWAQRDEVPVEVHRSVKERVSPFLRKTDSMWMLRSKKESKSHDLSTTASYVASPGDIKHKKSTFLARFMR